MMLSLHYSPPLVWIYEHKVSIWTLLLSASTSGQPKRNGFGIDEGLLSTGVKVRARRAYYNNRRINKAAELLEHVKAIKAILDIRDIDKAVSRDLCQKAYLRGAVIRLDKFEPVYSHIQLL
ncbi:hypothetical protein GGR57DRAFT_463239 [Xylariaceae sp. FL1272]|nr:hypothetical protein GGR57DRAFT_463239 [Xylariaceae sp. FL1272]